MKILLIGLIPIFLFASFARAQTAASDETEISLQSEAHVLQTSPNTKRAKIEFPTDQTPHVGDSIEVTLPDGTTCEGSVTQTKGHIALALFSSCRGFSKLKVGSAVTLSEGEAQDAKSKTKSSGRWLRFAGAATFDSASQMAFNNLSGSVSGLSFTGNATFQMNSGYALDVEVLRDKQNSIGFIAGLNYEFPRTITSGATTISAGGQTVSQNASIPGGTTISFLTLYGDLLYRMNEIYFIGGGNIANVGTNAAGALSNPSIGYGGQIGGGYYLYEFLALEATCRYITFSEGSTNSGNVTYNAGSTQIISAHLAVKGVF